MIIEKIDIKCFGRLQNLTLEFNERLNVIEGQNESGKSTIAGFIKYMLFGFEATEAEGKLGERRRRINWQTGIAEGSMNVSVKGKKYLITRSTVMVESQGRTSYKEESSIIDLESGTPAFGKSPAGEVFFGIDRELFENTAFVGQVGDASIEGGSVKEAIENILFSGNEKVNIQRAQNKISAQMESLLHPGNTGGAIFDLVQKQEELEGKLRAIDNANKAILTKEAELHEIRLRRREAQDKLNSLIELDECYGNVMVIQSFDKLHELEEELERANEEYSAFLAENTVNSFLPEDSYLTDIALARRAVDDTYTKLTDAEEAYAREKNALGITREIEGAIQIADSFGGEDKIKKELASYSKHKILSSFGAAALLLLGAILFTVALTVSALAPAINVVFYVIAALGLIGAAACGVYLFITLRKESALSSKFSVESASELDEKLTVIHEARIKRDTMMNNIERAKGVLENAKSDSETARSELMRTVTRWGSTPPLSGLGEFLDALEDKVKAFLKRRRELFSKKDNLESTVHEIRQSLGSKSEVDIRAQVAPLKRKVLAEINHQEIVLGKADAKSIIEEQDKLAATLEGELAMLKARSGDPGELYSKIQALESRIDELRAKHKAYYVALSAISSASDNLRAEVSPRLGEYAAQMLGTMSNKKYSDLTINDALGVSFKTDDSSLRSVDYLSGGTRDLAYIAVRMALVDMLYNERPPIIFDETFANQDNSRAEAMMKAIIKLGEEGTQSFIFTCRAREAGLANELQEGCSIFKLSINEG